MNITDTHTHLYSEAFDEDRNEMIQRAISSGVSRFFIPAIDSTYVQHMFELQKNFPKHIFLMAGLHPTHVKENYLEELSIVEKLLEEHTFYAIGETGIDLYWDKTFLSEQQKAFSKQIQLAKKHKLPIVIHCRDAFDEVFEVLESEKSDDLFGIFHCFSGNEAQAQRAISYGLKLGIGGVVTFKNGKIDTFLKNINLKHIVLETDAPYLAPVPYRGKRNESAYIVEVVKKLSSIYALPEIEIARITTENSKSVFGI
ncbi:TatD family hydrolase [Capnocytophaga canimorsus]|uniref:TatD family hydrolase n=1 Tax=Capnocytophaga canimorsus TaxID=28188 RepID=UPI0018E2FA19|nr:TatD family hydrolase [Capnocytophaga canimorsus]